MLPASISTVAAACFIGPPPKFSPDVRPSPKAVAATGASAVSPQSSDFVDAGGSAPIEWQRKAALAAITEFYAQNLAVVGPSTAHRRPDELKRLVETFSTGVVPQAEGYINSLPLDLAPPVTASDGGLTLGEASRPLPSATATPAPTSASSDVPFFCWGASLCFPLNYAMATYAYDMVCVEYNLAVCELQLARLHIRLINGASARRPQSMPSATATEATEAEVTKRAYHLSLSAADRFQRCKGLAESHLQPYLHSRPGHPDVHADTHPLAFEALKCIALAQAQMIGWAKVAVTCLPMTAKTTAKDSLACKLAHQCAILWQRAVDAMKGVPSASSGTQAGGAHLDGGGGAFQLLGSLATCYANGFFAIAHSLNARMLLDQDAVQAVIHAMCSRAYVAAAKQSIEPSLVSLEAGAGTAAFTTMAQPPSSSSHPRAKLQVIDATDLCVAFATMTQNVASSINDAVEYINRFAMNAKLDEGTARAFAASPEAAATRQRGSLPAPSELARPKRFNLQEATRSAAPSP